MVDIKLCLHFQANVTFQKLADLVNGTANIDKKVQKLMDEMSDPAKGMVRISEFLIQSLEDKNDIKLILFTSYQIITQSCSLLLR